MAGSYNLLFEVTPLSGGSPVTLRLTNADADTNATTANGQAWLPCITKLPTVSINLGDDGLLGEIQVSRGEISFFCSDDFNNHVWSSYIWNGAVGRCWIGAAGSTYSNYIKLFEGKVTSLERDGNFATVRLSGPEADLTGDLLTSEYAGTGGAEGSTSLKGTLKPRCYGAPQSVEPIQIDATNLVYQVHGYGAVSSIQPYEYGSPLDSANFKGNVATYAALIALTLVPGEWATCLAQGMFRFGGTPTPKVSADVTMPSGTLLSQIAVQMLTDAGVAGGSIGDFSAFNTISSTLYLTSQASVLSTLQNLFKQAGGYVIADKNGVWQCGSYYNSTKTATALNGDRSTFPLLLDFKEEPTKAPIWKVRYGYDHCWGVHSDSEASPVINELAQSVTEASIWDNITGSNKPADNATVGATSGTNLYASTGTVLQDSAIITSQGTAGAISGQSPWATYGGFSPAALFQQNQNVIYNPSGTLGMDGWVNEGSALIGGTVGGYGEGAFFQCPNGSTGQISAYEDVTCLAGTTISLQALIFAGGLTKLTGTVAQARFYVQWLNAAKAHVGYTAICAVPAGTGWTFVSQTGQVAPAGTQYARVRIDCWGDGTWSNTNCAWAKLKIEVGNVCTPFTDDATYGAIYKSGQTIDSLKPAQIGSDVTSSNTAAAISGQAATATSSDFSVITGSTKPANNATRNQVTYSATAPASPADGDLWVDLSGTYAVFKLRSGGAWVTGANALSAYNTLSGRPIALSDINTTESTKLAGIATGADVTSANTASAIAGQGPLATVASAAPYTNANVPLGENLVINSDMALMDATFSSTYPLGFEFAWQGNMSNIASITWSDSRIQMADKTYAVQRSLSGVAPTPTNCVFDGIQTANTGAALARFCIPIQPGDVLFGSAYIGHQNCSSGGVVIGYLDENGAYVGEAGVTYATADIGATAVSALRRDQLGRSKGFVTVPADGVMTGGTGRCRWARIWTRFNLSGSPTTSRGISSGLMLSKVASGQTAIPAYSSGPSDRLATYGAITGTTLQSTSLGVLTDGQVVTGQGTAAAITNQGALATSTLTASQVTNTNIPLQGQNRAPFSLFEAGVTSGWGFFADTNATTGTRTATTYGGFPAVAITGSCSTVGPRVIIEGPLFAVTGNEYLLVACQAVAGSNTNVTAQVLFQDASGAYLTELNATTITAGLTGRSAIIIQAPSTATKGRFRAFINANSVGSMSATIGQPMVCGAMAGQSSYPAFSAGPNSYNAADVTGSNVAAGFTGQGALATQNSLAYGSSYLTGFGGIANQNSVSTTQIVTSSGSGAQSDASLITAQGTASAITGQGNLATANRSSLAFGQNAVVNSDFARGSYGYTLATLGTIPANGNTSVSVSEVGVNLNSSYSGVRNVMYAHLNTNGTNWVAGSNTYVDAYWTRGRWNGGSMADQRLFGVSVKQGDTIFARSLMARHRCGAVMYALIYDKDGNLIEAPQWNGGRDGGGASGIPANFDVVGGCYTVQNANAATMGLLWRMEADGRSDPYLFMTEPAFGVLPAGQTVLPPYNAGREDPLSDQTSLGTAAAISGQGALATAPLTASQVTNSNITIGSNGALLGAGGGTVTIGGLGYSGALNATYGAQTGSSLTSGSLGVLNDGHVVTNQGVAASISGQSSWATYSTLAPSQVIAPNANLIRNPNFKLGLNNWGQSAAVFNTGYSAGDVGAYFAYSNDVAARYLYSADQIGIFANNAYTFQVYAAGSFTATGGNRPYIKIDWFNASGYISSSGQTFIDSGVGYKTYAITGTAPSNATWARGYIFTPNGGTNTWFCFSRAKLELGGTATPFTDDATNSAAYADGTVMDSLKPAQLGSDKTSSNTAAAISGQSGWATYTQFTPTQALAAGSGGNLVWKPSFSDGSVGAWSGSSAPTTAPSNGPDGSGEMGQTGRDLYETGNYLSVTAGEKLYVQAMCYNGSGGGYTARIGFQFTNASGGGANWVGAATLANGQGWTLISGWITVPSGAARALPWLQNEGNATGNPYIAWSKIYMGRSQPGSDITASNTAAAIAGQGGLATKNSVNTPELITGAVSNAVSASVVGPTSLNGNATWAPVTSVTVNPTSANSSFIILVSFQYQCYMNTTAYTVNYRVTNTGNKLIGNCPPVWSYSLYGTYTASAVVTGISSTTTFQLELQSSTMAWMNSQNVSLAAIELKV